MDVTRVLPPMNQPVEKIQEMNSPGRTEDRNVGAKEGPAPQDRVQLSDQYREVNLAKKVTMQPEEIRTEAVEQLRQAIKSGTYVVDPEKLADKMLGEIW